MPVWSALIWAACCAGAGAAAVKYNGKDRNGDLRRIQLLIAAAAAVIGGAGGWFAAIRTEAVQDQMRLLLVMMALCAAAGVDLLVRRIPNLLPLLLLAGFAVCTALDFILRPARAQGLLFSGVLGGAGILAVLGLCRLITRGGIGLGDVKLFSAASLLLGLYGGICTLALGQLAALAAAVALLLSKKATWKDSIPFAPFLALGFLICLILGTY